MDQLHKWHLKSQPTSTDTLLSLKAWQDEIFTLSAWHPFLYTLALVYIVNVHNRKLNAQTEQNLLISVETCQAPSHLPSSVFFLFHKPHPFHILQRCGNHFCPKIQKQTQNNAGAVLILPQEVYNWAGPEIPCAITDHHPCPSQITV